MGFFRIKKDINKDRLMEEYKMKLRNLEKKSHFFFTILLAVIFSMSFIVLLIVLTRYGFIEREHFELIVRFEFLELPLFILVLLLSPGAVLAISIELFCLRRKYEAVQMQAIISLKNANSSQNNQRKAE